MSELEIDITHFRIYRAKPDDDGKIIATFSVSFPQLGMEVRCWRLCKKPDGKFIALPPSGQTVGPSLTTVVMRQGHNLAQYLVTEATALYERALERELRARALA